MLELVATKSPRTLEAAESMHDSGMKFVDMHCALSVEHIRLGVCRANMCRLGYRVPLVTQLAWPTSRGCRKAFGWWSRNYMLLIWCRNNTTESTYVGFRSRKISWRFSQILRLFKGFLWMQINAGFQITQAIGHGPIGLINAFIGLFHCRGTILEAAILGDPQNNHMVSWSRVYIHDHRLYPGT